MSLRGIVAYKIPGIEKVAAKLPITIITCPVADFYLRHEYYDIPLVDGAAINPEDYHKTSHNECAVWWSFGLRFDIKNFTLREAVNLPLRGAPDTSNERQKYNSVEVTLGYRFSLK